MGSNDFLALLLEQPSAYAIAVAAAIAFSWLLSRSTRTTMLGGLLPYYGYLIINVAAAVFLWRTDAIAVDRFAHFMVTESFMCLVVCHLYKRVAPAILRCAISTDQRTLKLISIAVVLMLLLSTLYTGSMITDESSSRIEFQLTSTVFSFVKPFSYFAFATAAFLPFLQIRRGMSFTLTALTLGSMVTFSIAAQSKGSFLVTILSAYLLLREQGYFTGAANRSSSGGRNAAMLCLVGAAFVFNLYVLEVDPLFMLARVVFSGDSVFMTYPYPRPEELCAGVDVLSAFHRGLARALQFPAAGDPTTVFGVRLVQNVEIEDALRGPNARISSYSLCNFGISATLPFLLYASLLLALQRKLALSIGRRFPRLQLLLLPFYISTLVDGAQDVYKIMTGFTILLVLWLLVSVFPRLRGRNANARTPAFDRHTYQRSPI